MHAHTHMHTHAHIHAHARTHTQVSTFLLLPLLYIRMYNGRCGEMQGSRDSTNVVASGTVRNADSKHYSQVLATRNTSGFGHLHDGLNKRQHFMICKQSAKAPFALHVQMNHPYYRQ